MKKRDVTTKLMGEMFGNATAIKSMMEYEKDERGAEIMGHILDLLGEAKTHHFNKSLNNVVEMK